MYTKNCQECNNEFITNDIKKRFCCPRCSALYISRIRKQNGTLKHSQETRQKISKSIKSKVKKKTIYCKICGSEKGKCKQPEICKQYLIRKKSNNLKKLGFDFSAFGTEKIYSEYWKIYSYLFDKYNIKLESLRMICDDHNISCESSLCKIMDMFQIFRRSDSESLINYVLSDRYQPLVNEKMKSSFKKGWHTTWDGKQVYYRSSYELDLCKELDSKKIYYLMEFLRIPYYDSQKKKLSVSIVDFYLPELNKIIEVKSTITYNKINMIDRFKSYKKLGFSNYCLIYEHVNYGKKLPETNPESFYYFSY